MQPASEFDLICLGSGPAGQKAAIQAAKAGYRAAVIEREPQVGGSCLLSGTIPSKALREQALRYRRMRGSASSLAVELRGDAPLSALLQGVDAVIAAQDRYLQAQLARNQVDLIRGRAALLDAHRVEVQRVDGLRSILHAPRILLATGSRPRHVAAIQVDHEHVLDSDSVLSLSYIPRTLIVLGSGVIACEYASIFAALGCAVTLADKAAEPLGFLDAPLRAGFLAGFCAMGGQYRAGAEVTGARFDGFSQVEVSFGGGEVLKADIVFAAFGRVANVDGIGLDRVQVGISARGHVLAVGFATRGAMAGNREIIEVLHFVGAADSYISRQFQRHFFRLGLRGGLFGGGLAVLLFAFSGALSSILRGTPGGTQAEIMFGSFSLGPKGYVAIVIIAGAIAVTTGLVSRIIVFRHLRKLG
ncbi:MAG: FAD-dependent oxidoreductase [Steroidobacteraceae bacterium]